MIRRRLSFFEVITLHTFTKTLFRNCPLCLEDGSPMDATVMEDLRQWMDQIYVDIAWERGDVLLVDNERCMHARRAFEPPRRILAFVGKN